MSLQIAIITILLFKMSDSLLDHALDERKSAPLRNTWQRAQSAFGTKDRFQKAALKAVSREAGCPKAKHVSVLKEFIQNDYNKFEEFVVVCHALSPWSEKVTTCCKAIVAILVLLQTGPPVSDHAYEFVNHYLASIRDEWAKRDMFLYQFSLVLTQRLSFLQEHGAFKGHFNLSTMSSNGLSLPQLDTHSSVSVLSQLLSYQGMLLNLINQGIKNQQSSEYLRQKERETVKSALFPLYEDAYCTYVACLGILQFIRSRASSGTLAAAQSTVEVMTELFHEQFSLLRGIRRTLSDILSTNSIGNSYGTLEHDLSKLPENFPLNAEGSTAPNTKSSTASGALSISH